MSLFSEYANKKNVLMSTPHCIIEAHVQTQSLNTQGCGLPPDVENAAAPVYSATLLESTATYTCDAGFEMIGSGDIKCVQSGWETGPECNGTIYIYFVQ